MSFGLALSGGGSRGAAHVGVLIALEENGLIPSSISGTSAGSIVCGLYASGMDSQKLAEIVKYMSQNGKYLIDIDYLGFIKSIPKLILERSINISGIIKGNKLEKYFYKLTNGKNIKQSNIKIVIPTVDIDSGYTIAYTNSLNDVKKINKLRWKDDISIATAMRASSSVPAAFQPRMLDGMCLVDGGVTNILPVDLLRACGEDKILAVDISKNYRSPKKNNIFEISSSSLNIMNSCLKELTSTGEKLLLKPPLPENAGLLTFEHMVECMEIGYRYTKRLIPNIKNIFY